jgi:hypothetical protein
MDSTPVIELPQFFIPISLTSDLLMPLMFYVVAAIYTIFTGILYFHWSEYANNKKVISVTYITYLAMTLPLILTMAFTVFFF